MKIGTSKHPEKRVRELQTGTSDRLILHALEPGGATVEHQRHRQFAAHRGLGEWFICSKALAHHMVDTWSRYRVLPPAHAENVMVLLERTKLNRALQEFWPGGPDLVNPPLDIPWKGSVFLDLTGRGR